MLSHPIRQTALWAGVLLLSWLLAACGDSRESADGNRQTLPEAGKNNSAAGEPVTLALYNHNAGIVSQKDLEDVFVKPVSAKYPNISFELVQGSKLQDLIAAGEVPDLIASSNYYMNELLQLGVVGDLNGLVKKHHTDLSPIEPGTFAVLQSFEPNGELYAVPYAMNYGVMAYNKDIFDKFAAPYPTDNMTWSQVIELARKVTREENGTQYIGLDPGSPSTLTRAYSLATVDRAQEKAVLASEPYQKIFGLLRQVYEIPGIVGKDKKYSYGIDFFLKDQKLAMYPYWIANLTSRLPQLKELGKEFDWDVVSYPSFDDKPGLGREFDFHLLIIPPTSKHKEAAFQVIETLISEEAQKNMNRGTRLTVLTDPQLKKEFTADLNYYQGKNLQGIFKVKPSPTPISTVYDKELYSLLSGALKNMITKNQDANTALREANEQADQYIREVKAQ